MISKEVKDCKCLTESGSLFQLPDNYVKGALAMRLCFNARNTEKSIIR